MNQQEQTIAIIKCHDIALSCYQHCSQAVPCGGFHATRSLIIIWQILNFKIY
jgi:hypothetical protein